MLNNAAVATFIAYKPCSTDVSLIIQTDKAPIKNRTADTKIMCGMKLPKAGNKANEATEATICGKQIQELNKPM